MSNKNNVISHIFNIRNYGSIGSSYIYSYMVGFFLKIIKLLGNKI